MLFPLFEACSAPQVLDIYFKDNETVAFSWEEAITIEETGMYYLWFVICDAELSAATVSGSTIWKNPTGSRPPGLRSQSRHLRREAPCSLWPASPSVEQPHLDVELASGNYLFAARSCRPAAISDPHHLKEPHSCVLTQVCRGSMVTAGSPALAQCREAFLQGTPQLSPHLHCRPHCCVVRQRLRAGMHAAPCQCIPSMLS